MLTYLLFVSRNTLHKISGKKTMIVSSELKFLILLLLRTVHRKRMWLLNTIGTHTLEIQTYYTTRCNTNVAEDIKNHIVNRDIVERLFSISKSKQVSL